MPGDSAGKQIREAADTSAGESATPALWLDDSLAQHVFKHLEVTDCVLGAALVCRQWRRQTKERCQDWKEEFIELAGDEWGMLSTSGLC